MTFDNMKSQALNKMDKSKKGDVDTQVTELIEKINSHADWFTTSSCAGRIVLLATGGRKDQCDWLLQKHGTVTIDEVREALKKLPDEQVWFRMEPFILHVACENIDAAERLMIIAKEVGLKHSGIMNLKPKIMVELTGNETMSTLVAKDGKMLVEMNYLEQIIPIANSKLERNYEIIEKLEKSIASYCESS